MKKSQENNMKNMILQTWMIKYKKNIFKLKISSRENEKLSVWNYQQENKPFQM